MASSPISRWISHLAARSSTGKVRIGSTDLVASKKAFPFIRLFTSLSFQYSANSATLVSNLCIKKKKKDSVNFSFGTDVDDSLYS